MSEKLEITQKIIHNEPMRNHTSFKIGGNADLFVSVVNEDELKQALNYAKLKNYPITIIGNGSNLLVSDSGIRGLVIKIDIQHLNIQDNKNDIEVRVGSGNKMMALGIQLKENGISGFEELSGIPGTIGGAVFMNAGAYGKEMKDIVISTKCMNKDGEIFELSNEEQNFEYRSSIFNQKEYIILETKLKLQKGNKE
ncbi:MAG: UDP-N-acetylmuramate dehydrogenase, partial [Clostridia bacterium]|nr:UDP-N-acetylmuramate dehydrogenase [Clostridia bacterium]